MHFAVIQQKQKYSHYKINTATESRPPGLSHSVDIGGFGGPTGHGPQDVYNI